MNLVRVFKLLNLLRKVGKVKKVLTECRNPLEMAKTAPYLFCP